MRVFFWLLLVIPALMLAGVLASVAVEGLDLFGTLGWWGVAFFVAIPVAIWAAATKFPSRHGSSSYWID